ncbi:uncharacterized protein LOC120330148 [Styela clava]
MVLYINTFENMKFRFLVVCFMASTLKAQEQDFELSYIAEQMKAYCDIRNSRSQERRDLQNVTPRVGKAGPTGPQGIKGEPGSVDYDHVADLVQQKITVIENELKKIRSELNVCERMKTGLCPMKHNGNCYWAIKSPMTAVEGRALCQAVGGIAADVLDGVHFEKIRVYLATLASDSEHFWTGMNFNTKTRQVTLSDGTLAPHVYWHTGYPNASTGRTAILFSSESNPASNRVGYIDYYLDKSDNKQAGVICQI